MSATRIKRVRIGDISPSPENDNIYGAIDFNDIDLINLSNDIAENGLREPIQVSGDGWIVSGHRRYAACQMAKLKHVSVLELELLRIEHNETEWAAILTRYNLQRVKSAAVRVKEALAQADPNLAIVERESLRRERDCELQSILVRGTKTRSDVTAAKRPFLSAVLNVLDDLKSYWPLTVRQVHYRLLNDPPLRHASKPSSTYLNDKASYQSLVILMSSARVTGDIPWHSIGDGTRPVKPNAQYRDVATFIDLELHNLLRGYRRNLLQSQQDHIELIAEKITVQSMVERVTSRYCIPTTIGRGYCSLPPRKAIVDRFKRSAKDRLILLFVSDFDPDGEEIAESFARSIRDDFAIEQVVPHKVLLAHQQTKDWDLPPSMEAKTTSRNCAKFVSRYGKNVFELESILPSKFESEIESAIKSVIDIRAFNKDVEIERRELRAVQAAKHIATEQLRECLPKLMEDL